MNPLLPVSLFWFLPLASTLGEDPLLSCVPRKTVPYPGENAKLFHEDGVWNYSIMLLREDLGLLLLGAREVIYALDLSNITNRKASVNWEVTAKQQEECKNKGKDPEIECKNYIRILHTTEDGRMYVCGTNAFDPECDYMSYADGKLRLENKAEDGKGKCPFDPFQRYSSIMVGEDLYSATSMNFLGSEPVVMRSSSVSIRTEFKSTWLNEPNFISMAQMPESEDDDGGDDDKVYLFFSETAVEYDFYNKLVVSRVARVCKGDLGGQRTLQKKWTSFLKARVDCPVLESQLPYIIQDTYRWCEPQQHWRSCLFYAVFKPQSDTSDLSAVCAYRVSDISRLFSEGKYKTPVTVETSFVKWVMYSGDIPSPRPGACIDNEARKQGITQTLDLPDRTLQFIRDRPLMDQAVKPISDRPLLVRKGATFTRIIVDQVQAADGEKYQVMFIGTETGTLLKAFNYNGEMFIIEEVEIFQSREPIKILRLSNSTGQIYAGSENGAVQVPLATCGRCLSCMDCVLARDPYCGWDKVDAKCTALATAQRGLIQSVKHGDASLCPEHDPVKPVTRTIWPGGNLKLWCPRLSNLAKPSWLWKGSPLPTSARLQLLQDGLLISNASASDVGRYRCLSLEYSHGTQYNTTVAEYQVGISSKRSGDSPSPEAQRDRPSLIGLQATVGLLVVLLAVLLGWNIYNGHLPLTRKCRPRKGEDRMEKVEPRYVSGATQQEAQMPAPAEGKPLVSEVENGSHSNHTSGEVGFGADTGESTSPRVVLQYIKGESEI